MMSSHAPCHHLPGQPDARKVSALLGKGLLTRAAEILFAANKLSKVDLDSMVKPSPTGAVLPRFIKDEFDASTSRRRFASLVELRPPLVERGTAEARLAVKVRHVHAGISLPDESDDLLIRVPAIAHRASSGLRGFCFFAPARISGGRSNQTTE